MTYFVGKIDWEVRKCKCAAYISEIWFLRNSRMLKKKLEKILAEKWSPHIYKIEDDYEEQIDKMVDVVWILRQGFSIKDKMKIPKNYSDGRFKSSWIVQEQR